MENTTLNEAKSVAEIKKSLSGHRKIDARTAKFYLGDAPVKHPGTDVDLNAFKGQLNKINQKIGEYNDYMRMLETDAIPDSNMNSKFVKKVKSLKSDIDSLDKDLRDRRDAMEKKMKQYDMEEKDREKKKAKEMEVKKDKARRYAEAGEKAEKIKKAGGMSGALASVKTTKKKNYSMKNYSAKMEESFKDRVRRYLGE